MNEERINFPGDDGFLARGLPTENEEQLLRVELMDPNSKLNRIRRLSPDHMLGSRYRERPGKARASRRGRTRVL